MRLTSVAAGIVVLTSGLWTAGCTECDPSTFESTCEGDTRVECVGDPSGVTDPYLARKDCAGLGLVCRTAGTAAGCVLPTPCLADGCLGRTRLLCDRTIGYLRAEVPCGPGMTCVLGRGEDPGVPLCVSDQLIECTASTCQAAVAYSCDRNAGYVVVVETCSADGRSCVAGHCEFSSISCPSNALDFCAQDGKGRYAGCTPGGHPTAFESCGTGTCAAITYSSGQAGAVCR